MDQTSIIKPFPVNGIRNPSVESEIKQYNPGNEFISFGQTYFENQLKRIKTTRTKPVNED